MRIKISVVVPTYRRPTLLVRCLNALMNQAFDKEHYEIIIGSDGPDESTHDMIKLLLHEGFPFIHYFSLPEKKGPAAVRNVGWRAGKGELIAFTDDDCIPDSNWLNALWNAYSNQSRKRVAFTGKISVPISGHPTDYELNVARLQQVEFVTANCACTKQALASVKGFDENFSMAWREDSDLHFKLLEQNIPIHHITTAIITHPVRKEMWGVSLKEQKKTMFNALLYKKYPTLYRQKIQRHPPWNYYIIIISFLLLAIGFVFDNPLITFIAFGTWITFTGAFIIKRLHRTSRSGSHIAEMTITSFLIPFISIFWRLYGAWKYRVLFI